MEEKNLLKIALICSIIGIFIIIVAAELINLTGLAVKIVNETTEFAPEIYFCQQDDCEIQLISLIKNSSKVHCAFFDLDLENLIIALKEKNAKLIIDKVNTKEIKEAGFINYIENKNTYQLMHNKFCIFDDEIILTGSFNPTEKGNFYNDNNIIILHSKYLAENYETEFKELWNKNFGSGEKAKYPIIDLNEIRIENYFCPEDSCAEHVIDVLENAKEKIYFMTFSFTNDDIGDSLVTKHDENIEIKGVFENFQRSEWSEFEKLKEEDIDVKYDNNKANMHHKVFIIDEKIVITGSFNPTSSADRKNDENILIIHNEEIAEKYLQEFNRVWNL